MNKRLELSILTGLTVAYLIAIVAFLVGVLDRSLGYADIILIMIATMTYLVGCEAAFYLTRDEGPDQCTTVIDGQQCQWPPHPGNVHNMLTPEGQESW